MLYKTGGIVLHKSKYSESSLIVRIYTRQFGLQSYLVPGARSRKSKTKAGWFQAFNQLDLVVYRSERSTLHRIKEIKLEVPYQSIPFDPSRQSMAFFLAEVIYKSLEEDEPDEDLFDFLADCGNYLDQVAACPFNFHLWFLVKFAGFLGFALQEQQHPNEMYFDLREGRFSSFSPTHRDVADGQAVEHLGAISGTKFAAIGGLKFSRTERKSLLDLLLRYYQVHLEHFKELKSRRVLEALSE
ncbi:MAG: DNA repair protein RecO [Salibacteraceae bacterium]